MQCKITGCIARLPSNKAAPLGITVGPKNGQQMEDAMTHMRNALSTFGKLPCPQCGMNIIAPTWSEYASEGRVRYLWNCDACNYEFETTVMFKDHPTQKSNLAA